MNNAEKRALIQEMVERVVLAERNVAAWTEEVRNDNTKGEKERTTEMVNRAITSKDILWQDFDETLERLLP